MLLEGHRRAAQVDKNDDERLNWFDWRLWFSRQGITELPRRAAMRINNYPLLIQATLAGQGVALGWRLLVDDLLDKGELVKPLHSSLFSDQGFYLVTPANEMPGENVATTVMAAPLAQSAIS